MSDPNSARRREEEDFCAGLRQGEDITEVSTIPGQKTSELERPHGAAALPLLEVPPGSPSAANSQEPGASFARGGSLPCTTGVQPTLLLPPLASWFIY